MFLKGKFKDIHQIFKLFIKIKGIFLTLLIFPSQVLSRTLAVAPEIIIRLGMYFDDLTRRSLLMLIPKLIMIISLRIIFSTLSNSTPVNATAAFTLTSFTRG